MADEEGYEVIIAGERAALVAGFYFETQAEAVAVAIGATPVGELVTVHDADCDAASSCTCDPRVIVVGDKASA